MKSRRISIYWTSVSLLFICTIFFSLNISSLLAYDQNKEKEIRSYLEKFQSVYYYVIGNYVDEIEPSVLFEGAMKGLFESLGDPYSVYLDINDMQDMSDTTSGVFGGVGIYISKPDKDTLDENNHRLPYVEVVSPIFGTPAYKAGLHSGDYITKIDGVSTDSMSVDQVVNNLRGAPGTKTVVTILRGKNIKFEVDLIRDIIEIPTVKFDMIGKTGYMRIIQFTPKTENRFLEAINYFNNNHYESLIIDLRGNPGGLLGSVVNIADSFFKEGIIVSTKSRVQAENAQYKATRKVNVPEELPIVVLIDKGSASASEILTGALKDRHRALIMGETSYGKGSVQQVRSFGEGGFKLTMARYYTPNDINIDKTGIDADIEITEPELTDEEIESYSKILKNNIIRAFVRKGDIPNSKKISSFVKSLKKEYNLTDNFLNRIIKNEIYRTMDEPPVYDMEFDKALKEAVKYLVK